MSLFDALPDDLSWECLLKAAETLAMEDVAALQRCSHRFCEVLQPTVIATRRLPGSLAIRISSLAQLAAWDIISRMKRHAVTYEGASSDVREDSLPVISAFASVLKRFPEARLQIHAHTGRNAPPLYAPGFTRDRADEVAGILLVEHGISSERITARGWGKAVALAAGWPAGRQSARGELFIDIGGLLLPPWPSYYDGVDSASTPMVEAHDGMLGMSAEHVQMLLQMLQGGHLQMAGEAGPGADDVGDGTTDGSSDESDAVGIADV